MLIISEKKKQENMSHSHKKRRQQRLEMAYMLELEDKKFKFTIINMFKDESNKWSYK